LEVELVLGLEVGAFVGVQRSVFGGVGWEQFLKVGAHLTQDRRQVDH